MSLTDALAKLQAASDIKSAWLPGMLLRDGPDDYMRVHAVDEAGPWFIDQDSDERDPMSVSAVIAATNWPIDRGDPATVGCLLSLLREATDDAYVFVAHSRYTHLGDHGWIVAGRGWTRVGPTEGEALSAALIAVAEAS